MMINVFISIMFCLISHPHHTSVCDITYNEEKGTLEVIQRVFIEDLEHEISDERKARIDLIKGEKELVTKHLKQFMVDNVEISLDNHVLAHKWIGYKIEGSYLKMFIELDWIETKEIRVKNTIFLDSRNGQENVIHINMDNKISTQVCRKSESVVSFLTQ